jgi:DNA (cytosine-5)-methyltransferase 1
MTGVPPPLVYGDVCSGISAPTEAWKHLGWRAAFYAEIEPAPSAVLAHHHPKVKNHGDFTTIQAGDYAPIDVLVGGTPCQDFSIAGLRAGVGGERGNLTLEFLRLADRLRPRWLVWENVPGVLSSTSHVAPDQRPPVNDLDVGAEPEDGEERVVVDEYDSDEVHAFNSLLAGLSELGYGFAYRVTDAQYAGVPQRRRRIFVVGHIGRLVESGDASEVWDVRDASALSRAVFFERQSLSGDTPPRREPGQVAPCIPARSSAGGGLGSDFDFDGGLVAGALGAGDGSRGWRNDLDQGAFIPVRAYGGNNTSGPIDIATAVNASGSASGSASGRMDFESETFVCSTLDASYARLQGQSGQDANHGHSHLIPTKRQLLPGDEEHFDRDEWEHNGRLVPLTTHSLRGEGFDASEDGTGRGTPIVACTSPALTSNPYADNESREDALIPVAIPQAMRESGPGFWMEDDKAGTLRAEGENRPSRPSNVVMTPTMAVRRLTPRECERLQGFPDDFTLVPYRNGMMADGPRYKMLGNSMAVPEIRAIGERIQEVERLQA